MKAQYNHKKWEIKKEKWLNGTTIMHSVYLTIDNYSCRDIFGSHCLGNCIKFILDQVKHEMGIDCKFCKHENRENLWQEYCAQCDIHKGIELSIIEENLSKIC